MDRKSILILVTCFVLLMVWYPLMNRFYPPKSLPPLTNEVAESTNRISPEIGPAPGTNVSPAVSAILPSAPMPPAPIQPKAREQLLVLENNEARYVFTSYGGGLKQVDLKDYLQTIGNRQDGKALTNLVSLNAGAPWPVMSLIDNETVQGDGLFSLTLTNGAVRAEKQLTNGLRLVKEFVPSSNYLMNVTVRLENLADQPIKLPAEQWVSGTATPISPSDHDTTMLGVMDYDGQRAQEIGDAWFANRTLGCIPGTPRTEYTSHRPVVWTAAQNQFFALVVMPKQPAPELAAWKIDLPPPTPAELASDSRIVPQPFGFQAAFLYPGATLAPKQILERQYTIYAGPKEYNLLARLGARFGNQLDLIMNFGGFFGFFAKALLLSMNGLHALGLGYGLTIILITIIIKLLFWPLTNASTRSMKRMAALQPQIKALQEKYKDDPKKMNLKMMEFMKQNKVSPLSGCFPMLLQIPVFFGFYKMLRSAIELRGARFLWAKDLSAPDTVWMIPGMHFPVNPLPLIMGVTMLWQARMTPPSPGMDPVQQKVMKYMPLMFMVFLYNFSAGLTLYWTVQNLLTIAQMKLTRNVSATPDTVHKGAVSSPASIGSRKKRRKM
ncbi:MAG: membrane protein insertase YidC, partial [Candidatus Omnitrophica bacterium]|nr:membrane protein insertase YidC [Candidatus Omnitrophota bacterium]